MLKITAVEALQDNYIWLITGRGHAAVVDPGEAEPVIAALEGDGLTASAILLTHSHHDHVGGVSGLLERYAIPVYGPAAEPVAELTHPLRGGERLHLKGVEADLAVLDISGHTIGHIGYHGNGALFCGDTLFTAGCGKVFDGTVEQLFLSLEKIAALPDDTLIYCAHEYTAENLRFAQMVEPGNRAVAKRRRETRRLRLAGVPCVPSTLAREKATNPFLRCAVEEVSAAAQRFAGRTLDTRLEVFAALRHWRDSLG